MQKSTSTELKGKKHESNNNHGNHMRDDRRFVRDRTKEMR